MRRGEVWTIGDGSDNAGKPRPAVIVQDDRFDATASLTICAFATDPTDVLLLHLPAERNERNGLRSPSRLMVDKITTTARAKVGTRVGRLDDEDMVRLYRAMLVFLGLAGCTEQEPSAGSRGHPAGNGVIARPRRRGDRGADRWPASLFGTCPAS